MTSLHLPLKDTLWGRCRFADEETDSEELEQAPPGLRSPESGSFLPSLWGP